MELLTSLVRKGIRKEAIENPLQAAPCWPRRCCGTCWRACTRGPGRASGSRTWRPGATSTIARRGPAVQRDLPAAQGHPPDRRQRVPRPTSRSPRARHSSMLGMLRKKLRGGAVAERHERFYGVIVAEVVKNNRAPGVPPEGADRPGEGVAIPGCSDEFGQRLGALRAPDGRRRAPDSGRCPEKGEQVLVAFAHGDLSQALRAGRLWTAKRSRRRTGPRRDQQQAGARSPDRTRASPSTTPPDFGKLVIEDKAGQRDHDGRADGADHDQAPAATCTHHRSAGTEWTLRGRGGRAADHD